MGETIDITNKVREVGKEKKKFKERVKDWYHENQIVIYAAVSITTLFVSGVIVGYDLGLLKLEEIKFLGVQYGTNLAWARAYITDPELTRALSDKCGNSAEDFEKLAAWAKKLVEQGLLK